MTGEARFRAAVDEFFKFVEEQPNAARILLIVPQGNLVTVRLSRTIQQGATAGISELLKMYLPDDSPWQHLAAGEFLKEGLHALAKWWLSNPTHPRDAIVTIVMKACWDGFGKTRAGKL